MFLGAQKNRLIKTVLLSTHNICFGWEIRKIIFSYSLLSGGLLLHMQICQQQRLRWITQSHQGFCCKGWWRLKSKLRPLAQKNSCASTSRATLCYSKTCHKLPLKRRPKIGFQDRLSLNAGQKYCRMPHLALNNNQSLRPLFCLFLRGRLRQIS